MYLKRKIFEGNDSNVLFYEVVNSIKWYEMFLALIFSYSSSFALRAGTLPLFMATGFTLQLTDSMWSTEVSWADMQIIRC